MVMIFLTKFSEQKLTFILLKELYKMFSLFFWEVNLFIYFQAWYCN